MTRGERIAVILVRLESIGEWLRAELAEDDRLLCVDRRAYPSVEEGLCVLESMRRMVLYARDVIRVRDTLKPGSGWSDVDKATAVLREGRSA